MSSIYIDTLDNFAQKLSNVNTHHSKNSLIDLFLIRLLEKNTVIFKDPDDQRSFFPEVVFFANNLDSYEDTDGPTCIPIGASFTTLLEQKPQARSLLSRISNFFKNKTREIHLDETSPNIIIENRLHYKSADTFTFTRLQLLSHFYIFSLPGLNRSPDQNSKFIRLIIASNKALYGNYNGNDSNYIQKNLEKSCEILANGMREWSLPKNRGLSPEYHEMAQNIIIHDSVKMRFVVNENLTPLTDTYQSLEREERPKGNKENPIGTEVTIAVRLLCKRGIIPLDADYPKGLLARKIKAFLNYPKTEDAYRKHAEIEYANILKENNIS